MEHKIKWTPVLTIKYKFNQTNTIRVFLRIFSFRLQHLQVGVKWSQYREDIIEMLCHFGIVKKLRTAGFCWLVD